jgi:hypothetical protein
MPPERRGALLLAVAPALADALKSPGPRRVRVPRLSSRTMTSLALS